MRVVAALAVLLGALALAAPAMGASRDTLTIRDSAYGKMLFDGKGRALYLFTREKGRPRSRCYGDCAVAWPPFNASGAPDVGRGLDEDLLGTTRRRGGKRQITYGGHPLYYYVNDRSPGEVSCQDVFQFGGDWLVVSPDGKAIR
jgi:predicted lipoprotein with Yx(FWY)xxD motif